MTTVYLHAFDTVLGHFHTATTEKGVAIISLVDDDRHWFASSVEKYFPDASFAQGGKFGAEVERQITEYAKGTRRSFDLPLLWHCTPFHRTVLEEVARIPYGQVRAYGEIAMAVGHPRAARAVGTANAGNHLPLVVPCHRVVAANGIGGYGGGTGAIELKKRLLQHEGVDLAALGC
jgi:methylated-DNA-[protein]-cysteine S-methyltransferase